MRLKSSSMYAPQDPTPTWLRRLIGAMLLWALVCLAYYAKAQPAPPRRAAVTASTIAWLTDRLYIREATGRNDGPDVAALITAGGGVASQRPEYCGFTQAADQKAHKLPIPARGMQGAARAWFPLEGPDAPRTIYRAGVRGVVDSIRPGDLVGFDYGRGIHHVARDKEVVPAQRKGRPPRGYWTLAGNEGRGTRAGLHLTYYPAANIDAGARWDYYLK